MYKNNLSEKKESSVTIHFEFIHVHLTYMYKLLLFWDGWLSDTCT